MLGTQTIVPYICYPSSISKFAQKYLKLLILITILIQSSQSIDRNFGIQFTDVPESSVVPPGDLVFFACKTNIGKDQKIRWLHNGVLLDPSQRSDIKITNGQLSIKVRNKRRLQDRQKGRYECVAGMDHMYLMSLPAQLNIAHIDKFPAADTDHTIIGNVANNVILPCTPPNSVPPAIVEWYKDGAPVPISDRQSLVNLQHLLIENLTPDHGGQYTCHASNHLTGENVVNPQSINLTVLPENDLHKPRLLMEPRPEYHPIAGDNISIPCSASGAPKPTILWEHEAFNSQPMLVEQLGPREILQITNVNLSSSGQYTCKIWNSRGRKILRKTLVYVAEKPKARISSFTHDPHLEGAPLELYCEVEGFPIPEVYWVVNGKRKYKHKKHQWEESKLSESGKLLIRDLKLEDAGIYQCFAENEVGTVYDAVMLRVVPTMHKNSKNSTNDQFQHKTPRHRRKNEKLIPPSAPNVTQLSEDSVSITWSMPNISSQEVMFFKVQYRDLGKVGERQKSHWYTLDGEISPSIRSYEIPGLLQNHAYRFRVGAVIDNDNVLSKVSRRYTIEANTQKAPKVIPQIKHILNTSDTSLSVQWVLAENATIKDDIEGYFINFRLSTTGGPYSHLTIFGDETHSHILDNLQPGESYDIKVRAFNLNGAGPFSKVRYARTSGESKSRVKKEPHKMESKLPEKKEEKIEDSDAKLYLIIGIGLGCVCVVLFSVCMGLTLWRRHRVAAKFSSTNANIHNKYQDTSLQISTGLQYAGDSSLYDNHDMSQRQVDRTDTSGDSHNYHETSFSVTDHSFDNGLDQYSQGSTAYMQDSYRNLNVTNPSVGGESLADEYVDEPSGLSWKRRRKSEEIL